MNTYSLKVCGFLISVWILSSSSQTELDMPVLQASGTLESARPLLGQVPHLFDVLVVGACSLLPQLSARSSRTHTLSSHTVAMFRVQALRRMLANVRVVAAVRSMRSRISQGVRRSASRQHTAG